MSRRSLAIVVAAVLELALFAAVWFLPLPYVRLQPGSTVDVLSTVRGDERIQVKGHKAYYDDGELRMTTVLATGPEGDINLYQAVSGWLSDEDAIKPHDAVYPEDETDEENEQQGALQMQTSRDYAVAVALRALDIAVDEVPFAVVVAVESGLPADGKLRPGDRILKVGSTAVATAKEVVEAVGARHAGRPLQLVIEREDRRAPVTITPREVDGETRVGVSVEDGADYEFPFDVSIQISEDIGGPSAGLMFSLAVYDTLTPGSLTGGHDVAGTGEIAPGGAVGPIGGIEQKIVGAREAGAELFLVPATNCEDALDADNGDMRLVRVGSFKEAKSAIEAWVKDPDTDLPSCEDEG